MRRHEHKFKDGAPDTIRTYDLQFRKLSLYPAELRARTIN